MKNKIITRFHLRNGIIYLRLTVNGERTEISTNCRINNMVWNKSLQRINNRNEEAFLINSTLNTLLNKVEKIFNNLDLKGDTQLTLFYAYVRSKS
jgi:hypothetical protein